MKVCEIFESIQGEGVWAGTPVLFIRVSDCTRNCSFCDTSYHFEGAEMTPKQVIKRVKKSKMKFVVWTGGEPLLYRKEIIEVIRNTRNKIHHLETNGDLLTAVDSDIFDYICCSPKDKLAAKNAVRLATDIKVVTNLELNKELIPFATMLMPLTTSLEVVNESNERKVWDYCVKNKLNFCLRQHVKVWGIKKRGV